MKTLHSVRCLRLLSGISRVCQPNSTKVLPPSKNCSTGLLSYGNITVGHTNWARNMKQMKRTPTDALLAGYTQQFAGLKRELEELRYFCRGTVLKRMMKCGQQRCACQEDAAKRHGPYFEWTYKVKGKTVNVRLRPEEAPVYKASTQQYRKLKSLLGRMERLSRNAVLRLAEKVRSESSDSNRT